MEKAIKYDLIKNSQENYKSNLNNSILTNAIVKVGIDDVALNRVSIMNMHHVFSHEIETGKATDQKQSGRCWLFAGLNTLRSKIIRDNKFKDKDFEFSQTYLMFWDKFEKANFFLENIIKTVDEKINSQLMMWLLEYPMNDAGQWDMFVSLVEKYGVVPKQIMPETFHSSSSNKMNNLLNLKLRKYASKLRKMHNDGSNIQELREIKSDLLIEFYECLCKFLGEPPEKFNFEYYDKGNCFQKDIDIIPTDFFRKYVDLNLRDYVSVINAPTKDKPYNKAYTIKFLGNVIGGRDIVYLNLETDKLKQLAIEQIKNGETVWFGSDIGKMTDRDFGIMDTELYNYDEVLNTDLSLTKEEMLDYRESCLTHAMVISGVNLINGKPDRWKVENSWGSEKANKGYYVMSDQWFEKYTYQVVIHKKYIPSDLLEIYHNKPIELEPWDPMGSLALTR